MRTIITVKKERVARCDYSVTVIKDGAQVKKDEFRGDAGDAAAAAINHAARNKPSVIVSSKEVGRFVPAEFGGTL